MNKTILTLCFGLLPVASLFAQVGIGVANPHTNAILDLTNTNNKGLLLPTLSSAPTATSGPEGMIFYYSNNIYMRDGVGFNAITPWKYKYNGSTSEAVYFNPTGYVGVGIGVTDANVKGNFHVSVNSKDVSASGTSAIIFLGDDDASTHMIIDVDELMVKNTATTGGLLKLQEEDGSIMIGSDRAESVDYAQIHLNTTIGSSTNSNELNVYGKVSEYGNELLPVGTIIMWSGTTAPAGWALCDGGSYAKLDGSGNVTVPDFRGRFIAGYTSTDADYNAIGDNGGQKSVTLSANHLPNHTHSGTTNTDGSHTHD